jgi:multicomponent Na+:H+ antiporter subunit D
MGMNGAIFHIVNHAIIKSLLFLGAGVVVHQARTTDMYQIAGTFRPGRLLTCTFLIGVLSLGGLPFFNGFMSKWMIYIATLQVNPWITLVALVTTALTLAYGLKAFHTVFMTNPNPSSKRMEIPLSMSVPLVVLAGMCLLLGLMPSLGYQMVDFAIQGLAGQPYVEAVLG